MKLKIFPVLGLVIAVAFVTGCGKDTRDEVVQHIKYQSLMDTWASECQGSKLLDLSTRSFYKYAGNDFVEAYELYSDEKCTEPVGQLTYTGTFEIGDEVLKDSDIRKVDYHHEEAYLEVSEQDTADIFEKFCDIRSLKIGEKVNVSDPSGAVDCPIKPVPRNEFGLFQIKDGLLYLEHTGQLQGRPQRRSDRSNDLDTEHPMSKSQKDL